MNFLIFGDIFGRPGRNAVGKHIKTLQKQHDIDFTIANVENLSHGKGFTKNTVTELQNMGVDFFTSGNHVWKNRGELPALEQKNPPILRPANYPPSAPGRGWQIATVKSKKILIINLMGRVFMGANLDCPFRTTDDILKETKKQKPDIVIIDFHAEASSEKVALGHYLDGRISLLYGTHTHVPTADGMILSKGTGYITDVGFTGPTDSVIGVKKEIAIQHFLTQMPVQHEVAEGGTTLNALICSIDDKTGKTKHIQLITIRD